MNYIIISSDVDQKLANALLDTNFANTALAGTPETDEDYASGIVVMDRKTFTAADDLPEPDAIRSNGSSTIRKYSGHIDGVTIFIEGGDNDALCIYPAGTSILNFLDDGWDFGSDGNGAPIERCVGLAEFGYDDQIDEANEDDTDVRIWCAPNYYAGTLGAPNANFVRDEQYDPLVFATYADAQAWIDDAEDGIYVTDHGEAGRPEYTIVK